MRELYSELLGQDTSRLLKKTHMLRCAQSSRSNVLIKYASARRFFARLASEIFLSSLETEFFSNVLLGPFTLSQSKGARSDRGESTVTIH
jgi:hypothetical protein